MSQLRQLIIKLDANGDVASVHIHANTEADEHRVRAFVGQLLGPVCQSAPVIDQVREAWKRQQH